MRIPTPAHPAYQPDQPATMVAIEAVLLWPRNVGRTLTSIDEASRWPVFAIVVSEPDGPVERAACRLFDLLDRPNNPDLLAVVDGHCRWSVLDARHALLRLAVHASAPVRFDVDIVLPARPVLGILDVLAHGATIAITTPPHASKLTGRLDIREALNELVLLNCAPSAELAALASALHRTHAG